MIFNPCASLNLLFLRLSRAVLRLSSKSKTHDFATGRHSKWFVLRLCLTVYCRAPPHKSAAQYVPPYIGRDY